MRTIASGVKNTPEANGFCSAIVENSLGRVFEAYTTGYNTPKAFSKPQSG